MVSPVRVVSSTGDPTAIVTSFIANAGSLSAAIDLGFGNRLVGIVAPAAWTAAVLTFQASFDGVNYFNLFGDTAEYSIPTAIMVTGNTIYVDRTKFDSVRFLKVRSGTTAAPVAQGAQRDFKFVTLPSKS